MKIGTLARLGVIGAVAAAISNSAAAQPWVDAENARQLLRDGKVAEAAAAYGALAKANPFDGFAWSQYGFALHGDKKYEQALEAYAKAAELGYSRPGQLYNSACALALLGRTDDALAMLERALKARFADQETLENDTDLDSLRADPRFAALTGLIGGLKERPAATREAGWAWDLDFMVRRMEQMHWDLYAKVPEETFRSEVDRLKRDVASLSDSQVRARLRRITALVGDGHTTSYLRAEGEPRLLLPLHMFKFTDGLYIIGGGGADGGGAALAGAKVLKVGPLDADAALAAARPYISVDNEMGYLADGPLVLTSPPIFRAIGAAPDESGVDLLVLKQGATSPETVRVTPVDRAASPLSFMHDREGFPAPLFARERKKQLWIQPLPEHKAVYFRFGAVMDTEDGTLREFAERVFAMIKDTSAEHLIIDMRFNGGGNTGLIRPLVHGLIACEAVNRRGHLYVLIGRNTFSAAQNTVNFIERNTHAIFVGEPTGSSPAFVGESTSFMLPHSRTGIVCSSRYWQQMDSTDERTWVQPQIVAQMSFADYAAGRDPAMEAVMKWIGGGDGTGAKAAR